MFFPDADRHYTVGDIFDIEPFTVPYSTLATCSFPCIDLSLAGNRNGIEGKHSSAFWGFVNILKAQGQAAPALVMVENVPGWLSSNGGVDFRTTVQALNQLGYVCDVFTLDALHFTPQSRQRVFLVGTRFETRGQDLESRANRPRSLLSDGLRRSLNANQDLDWFSQELPEPPPQTTNGLFKIIEGIEASDSRWWSQDEVQRHLQMMDESHLRRVKELQYKSEVSYRTFYRRRRQEKQRAEVRNDDLSGCLRTAVGGSGKQFLIQAGGGVIRMRTMTPREYAWLQGVPDHFEITVNGVQALTGFGDAVCVPAISWIAEYVLTPLAMNSFACEPHARP